MLPQLADLDITQLSDQDRDALEAAYEVEFDGVDEQTAADSRGISVAELQQRIARVGARWREISGTSALRKLTADEYQSLRDSIAEHGQQVEILADVDGNVIDGRHRLRACRDLGIEPRIRHLDPATAPDQLKSLSLVVNLARRQLTAGDRRGIIRDQLLRDASRSDRTIAAAVGVSHPTVAAVRRELEVAGDVESLSTRTDATGRAQPARKPEREQREEQLPDGLVDVTLRLTREYAADLDGGAWMSCNAIRLVLVAPGTYTLEARE